MLRATQTTLARQTLYDLNNASDRLSKVQNQLSTGKQINQPEDDPFGAGRALFLRDELADVQQYQRNINEGSTWLTGTDTALGNANDIMQSVRTLVVQASNGTLDQADMNAISTQIGQLKESLRDQSPTKTRPRKSLLKPRSPDSKFRPPWRM